MAILRGLGRIWFTGDKICGSDKILFGTDNPINGLDTYNDDDFYNKYFTELKVN